MGMKFLKKNALTAFAIFVVVLLGSCNKENNSSAEGNHTIYITNNGSSTNPLDTNGVGPKQFTSLKLIPKDSTMTTVTFSFVSNPGTTISLKANIPAVTTMFKIVVYTAEGQFIFWNSVAMIAGGTTTISLQANSNGFTDNSLCNGIPPDGSNIK